MTGWLVSLDGEADIPLDRAVLLVGRDPCCDARLNSLQISRRHCCLSRDGVEITVRDLGSVNGTWINGRRAESGRLRAGDELSIGRLRYRLTTGPAEIHAFAPAQSGGESRWTEESGEVQVAHSGARMGRPLA